jgi:deoxyribodipyrimidine photo-lyase
VDARPDRLSHRRRRHAPALDHGLDAQPRPHGHSQLPDQAPADRLWREGEKWFWDCLVDADLASNVQNWQWVAGSGADASPYFRIFNPITQGRKFDEDGRYLRRWVPELAKLPDRWLHAPWEAPPEVLRDAGVRLGSTYPRPIVEHDAARKRALDALKSVDKVRRDRED